MKSLVVFLIVLIISPLSAGCANVHDYGAYYGKVVDAETKEPLEGAAMLAVYYTSSPGQRVHTAIM